MYSKIEEELKEVIPIQKLTYVAFLHFESDEWGGMAVLDSADARLVCSDLSSTLNLTGWYNVPSDYISFWDNETLKMPQTVTWLQTLCLSLTPCIIRPRWAFA
jgi:flavorubredoxin